jgi:hypothetical protein
MHMSFFAADAAELLKTVADGDVRNINIQSPLIGAKGYFCVDSTVLPKTMDESIVEGVCHCCEEGSAFHNVAESEGQTRSVDQVEIDEVNGRTQPDRRGSPRRIAQILSESSNFPMISRQTADSIRHQLTYTFVAPISTFPRSPNGSLHNWNVSTTAASTGQHRVRRLH